jgi:hypothetical protein
MTSRTTPQHADTPNALREMKPTSNYANHLRQKAAGVYPEKGHTA